jgi:hypothetical protein
MQPISQLGAALAAVPVAQPCTAAAVRALHVEGHAAARQLAPAMYLGMPAVAFMELQEACTRQQLPGACMPVLAWLADGLSSGLPAATSLQAHDMVCVLLGVVSLVVPSRLQTKLWDDAGCDQQTLDKAVRLLQQLGGNLGACLTNKALPHNGNPALDACSVWRNTVLSHPDWCIQQQHTPLHLGHPASANTSICSWRQSRCYHSAMSC